MIDGAHVILYSQDADADRAFLQDTLGFGGVDAGRGWVILRLPPSEVAVHPVDGPTTGPPAHELYLMCDDIAATLADLAAKGVASSTVTDEGWGLLSRLTLPSGAELGIYEPRHPRAHDA
jgi:hypothetical protein